MAYNFIFTEQKDQFDSQQRLMKIKMILQFLFPDMMVKDETLTKVQKVILGLNPEYGKKKMVFSDQKKQVRVCEIITIAFYLINDPVIRKKIFFNVWKYIRFIR